MGKKIERESDRLVSVRKIIQTMILISQRGYTLNKLAIELKVSYRTVWRYMNAIERLGVPLIVDKYYYDYDTETEREANNRRNIYRIENHWMRRFL